MTKIKYIHCFGTSYTAGGGFEFESLCTYRRDFIKSMYGHLDENFTQFNFSYPGQLQKLLGNDIKVFNHGKNGYGNELLYRKIYDIVSDYNFNPDENIFLLELSALGRREFWINEINDFVIVNYQIDWDNLKYSHILNIANSYWYDTTELETLFEKKYRSMFHKFLKRTLNVDVLVKQMSMNMEYVISYIQNKNVKFYSVVNSPLPNFDLPQIEFGDGNYFTKSNDFIGFCYTNKLSITDETLGKYVDGHNGYIGNKITAESICNKFIDDSLIKKSKIDINWKRYKDFNYRTKTRML
jgi:hypothetical protein